ncbi:MAG: ABC transporter ATP-binding protein [Lachnospiraceae bacterium]|nr:ABC transporter ATP-binding protein [Lachnospiraceae bacterium]
MRIQLEHLHKTAVDGSSFIRDLNLEIEEKEFVALVGPRGCGKSTVLRVIAGLEQIQSGAISIDDRRVESLEPKDRHVSMIFSNSTLMPDMTVQENMAFRLKQRKIPKEECLFMVREAAELLGITHLLKKKPRALSPLETQKVILGRAVAGKPRVLLLDDPYAALDEKLKLEMHFVVSLLFQQMDTTIVYSTNDPMTAMALGTKIVVMDAGHVVQKDEPMAIYEQPGTLFAAELFGQPPINVWDAKVIREDGQICLSVGKYALPLPTKTAKLLEAKGYLEKEVIAAIRPENIEDEEIVLETMQMWQVSAQVLVRQMLGAVAYLELRIGEMTMVASVNPRTAASPGQKIKVVLDLRKILLFDKQSRTIVTK